MTLMYCLEWPAASQAQLLLLALHCEVIGQALEAKPWTKWWYKFGPPLIWKLHQVSPIIKVMMYHSCRQWQHNKVIKLQKSMSLSLNLVVWPQDGKTPHSPISLVRLRMVCMDLLTKLIPFIWPLTFHILQYFFCCFLKVSEMLVNSQIKMACNVLRISIWPLFCSLDNLARTLWNELSLETVVMH